MAEKTSSPNSLAHNSGDTTCACNCTWQAVRTKRSAPEACWLHSTS